MRVLVCDDESICLEAICASIQRWRVQRGAEGIVVSSYRSSEELLDALDRAQPFDLAFLDIQFPGELSGLELAEYLRRIDEQLLIVFTTNYEKYAMDGYKVNALRYLQKPPGDLQIFECLDIAYRQWRLCNECALTLMEGGNAYRIAYKFFLYAESKAHYIDIHLAHQEETIRVRMKLSELLKRVPESMIVQCHRGFAVNLQYVQKITRKYIELCNGTAIPVGRNYWENTMMRFKALYEGEDHAHSLDLI